VKDRIVIKLGSLQNCVNCIMEKGESYRSFAPREENVISMS